MNFKLLSAFSPLPLQQNGAPRDSIIPAVA
jgi:hypothetical protein